VRRWQLSFSRGEEVKFLSHLDLMRLWERALRRAGLPLAYSQGFSPHPRLSLALPLPVGVTSQAELLELWLQRPLALDLLLEPLRRQLPRGIALTAAQPLPERAPALPSRVRFAEYLVEAQGEGAAEKVASFLGSLTLPWSHHREGEERRYDLRPLVVELRLTQVKDGWVTLAMRLRADASGTARPEQVALALGLQPLRLHRTRLVLEGD